MNNFVMQQEDGTIKYLVEGKEVTEQEFLDAVSKTPKPLGVFVHETIKTEEKLSK